MNREIKFRGYATGIGWVYGSLVNNLWTYSELSQHEKGDPCYEIITGKYEGDCWEDITQQEGEAIISVVPDSVGQYTGLKDKNGKEIYEGDILCWPKYEGSKNETRWAVEWDNKRARWSDWSPREDAEIIGNIYERPELLPKTN